VFLAFQDPEPPVRQAVYNLPTSIIHSGLSPPSAG